MNEFVEFVVDDVNARVERVLLSCARKGIKKHLTMKWEGAGERAGERETRPRPNASIKQTNEGMNERGGKW